MANLAVEANILAALPPGVVSAEWVDLSEQLGQDFVPEKSRIVKAITKKEKIIYYAGHETADHDPFFLEIHLPNGDVATEPGSQSVLRQDLIGALNQLAETP